MKSYTCTADEPTVKPVELRTVQQIKGQTVRQQHGSRHPHKGRLAGQGSLRRRRDRAHIMLLRLLHTRMNQQDSCCNHSLTRWLQDSRKNQRSLPFLCHANAGLGLISQFQSDQHISQTSSHSDDAWTASSSVIKVMTKNFVKILITKLTFYSLKFYQSTHSNQN